MTNYGHVTFFNLRYYLEHSDPLEIFVARQCIHSLIDPKKGPISDKRHYIVCISLWATSLGIALAVTDLGIVLELTGGLSATIIGMCIVCLCCKKPVC